jgi:putative ABC transport system permease protein
MFLFESIAQAWHSLVGHKLRTGLTMFGIMWGITSVIILVGMGRSSQRLFYHEFEKIGEKAVIIVAGTSTSGLGGIRGGKPVRFTVDDVKAIRVHCPLVELVSPHVRLGYQETKYGGVIASCDIFGIDENSEIIRNLPVSSGRFISFADCESGRRVCVIGANVKEKLFGSRRAEGDFIRVGGIRLQVIGTLVKKGEQISRPFESLDDDQLFIPYTTAQRLFTGSRYFDVFFMQPYLRSEDMAAREQIRQTLGHTHGFLPDDPDALDSFGTSENIARVEGVLLGMQIFLGASGIITLLIGGIGVMNIMFVSINERIREIGIMKAVGATRRHVFMQFLVESIFITFVAGFTGAFLGCSVCLILGAINLPDLVAAPEIDPLVIGISFFTMTLVGVTSGILPALKASKMQVVEALRFM